jgi:hypothetical protein
MAKVLNSVGVIRINKNQINSTLEYISAVSGIPTNDLRLLGSTGKNDTSGDIDIAIDSLKYDADDTHERMVEKVGSDHAFYNTGTKVRSYAIPIEGDPQNGFVQLDFMFVESLEWAAFSYFSAGDKATNHKGVVRTVLLRSIASTLDEEGIDKFIYDPVSNDLMVRIGRTMDINCGFRRIIQFRPKKKRGEGYLGSLITTTPEELNVVCGIRVESVVTDFATVSDPSKFLELVSGFPVAPKDVDTAEQVVQVIKRLPASRQLSTIKTAMYNLEKTCKYNQEQLNNLFECN